MIAVVRRRAVGPFVLGDDRDDGVVCDSRHGWFVVKKRERRGWMPDSAPPIADPIVDRTENERSDGATAHHRYHVSWRATEESGGAAERSTDRGSSRLLVEGTTVAQARACDIISCQNPPRQAGSGALESVINVMQRHVMSCQRHGMSCRSRARSSLSSRDASAVRHTVYVRCTHQERPPAIDLSATPNKRIWHGNKQFTLAR